MEQYLSTVASLKLKGASAREARFRGADEEAACVAGEDLSSLPPVRGLNSPAPTGLGLHSGDRIIGSFLEQKENLLACIRHQSRVTLGTLGPAGTTSHNATFYLIDYLKEFNPGCQFQLRLWDNFDLVVEGLQNREVDFIVVPNAYEKITEMYWDLRFDNLFSFLLDTPEYGIAARKGAAREAAEERPTLASCKPVLCLIEQLGRELLSGRQEFEVIVTESTTKAAELLGSGGADYAITNQTSLAGSALEFVSKTCKAKVLWSIFTLKQG